MKIKSMRPFDGQGKTKAFFSVEWEGKMTVNDCKLIAGNNGLFAAMPSRQYEDKKSGEKKYQSIVYLEQDLLNKVSSAAQEEYNRLTGKGSTPAQDESDIPF